jgi:hypothetical protein
MLYINSRHLYLEAQMKAAIYCIILPILILTASCSSSTADDNPWKLEIADLDTGNFTAYPVSLPENGYLVLWTTNHKTPLLTDNEEWWHDAVVYQTFTHAFNGGQLPTSRLDYLTNAGFTAVWTTPIHPSPSTHGYDATDYRAIHASYGGMSAFDEYLAAADSRGIRVILDLVINHTSSQHPWFVDSRNSANDKRDWYVWANANPMYLIANHTWEVIIPGLSTGALFKFEVSGGATWGANWGDANQDGIAGAGEGNISVETSGTIRIRFNDATLAYSMTAL